MTMRAHEEYEENIGAYLLGALTELEADVFERHLMGCESCRAEVERLRVAAEALPRTVTPMRAPPELKASLMQVVNEEAAARSGGRSRRRAFSLPALPRLRPAMAWVSAAFLLLVGVGVGVAISGIGGDDTRTLAASVDRARLPQTSGSLLVASHEHGGVLRVQGLPEAPRGRVYQVWLMRGDEVIPGALFEPRSDGTGEAGIPDDLDGYDAVLVTREPEGGGRKPSEKPVLSVQLS
jgi:hypothetical protein